MSSEEDPLVAQCRERIGQMLSGKWRLDALIGVGGMAAVYASTHRNGARAAIKVLHAEYAGHQEVRSRFLREAYIANKVDHPGTVRVLDDDIGENGEPYIVMELLAGESVESRSARNGGWLRYPEVLSIIDQTLAVLEKAHANGIVHRDLKPDNLFLTTRGEVKVLDFGIARLHEAEGAKRTQTGMMMGTPAFMAPEQALGRWAQVDGRTDLWSVGAIFVKLLSGRYVHEAQTDNEMLIRAATRPAPSLARIVPNAPLELVRVVDRVLSFEQAGRFADASAMRSAVQALMAAAGVATPAGAAQPLPARAAPLAPTQAGVGPALTAAMGQERAAPAPGSQVAPGAAPQVAPGPAQAAPVGAPRAAPAAMVAAATGGAATIASPVHGGAPAAPAVEAAAIPASPGQGRPAAAPPRARADNEGFDAVYATAEDVAAMRDLFGEIEKALIAKTQYGPVHPETRRRADRAFTLCASGLMKSEYGFVWGVTPYSFTAGEETLWEPDAPLDRIPYQLFADGVRLLGLTSGLDETEFQAFFRLLTLDRATEVAPEDDFATLLWDADFQHVAHQIVDTFSDGDHAQRLAFEGARERVVQLAHFDTTEQLVECWQERQKEPKAEAIAARHRRIATRLGQGPVDAEAAARAADVRVAGGTTAVADPAALRVDDALRTMLGARLTMETGGLSERFAVAVARAFEDGLDRDGAANVTTPLRFAVDGLARENPELSIDMVGVLCREVGSLAARERGEALRSKFAAAIVSPKMVESVLEGVCAEGANRAVYAKGLRTILGYCDETYFTTVLKHVGAMPDAELRDVLLAYLTRTGAGHEAEMGKLFVEADIELGLCLVRILAAIPTTKAREAISQAAHSPHPVVRIEALGHVEGVSSERLRLELRTLLEDRDPGVRLAALKAMEQYSIRVAGPFLVLRVRSQDFDGLPIDERRQAFLTLGSLAANRSEAVAIELVKERRLVPSSGHEASRELAVEVLGRLGVTDEARQVLEELSTARFRNSDRVRAAAAKALEAMALRKAKAAQAPASPGKAPVPGKALRS